ncbi:uncharacterized protein BXZ73DRAFT_82103 [Epithele typhae]|uniref:uncharacterized protein n=1 Tax=Epithele typhae TaxID=378194 RepID=UPI002008A31C|nr:uncharacterized protein BXZ73DRAFT_82103 [Epithele typhae]KAH9912929.1 hypothetical protein BXZ73DRAFT_82103 [Epithele typhae]
MPPQACKPPSARLHTGLGPGRPHHRRGIRSFDVLDDGSCDSTADVVLKRNVGEGGVVRHGMLHRHGWRLLMVDAHGTNQFKDMELLWKTMDEISRRQPHAPSEDERGFKHPSRIFPHQHLATRISNGDPKLAVCMRASRLHRFPVIRLMKPVPQLIQLVSYLIITVT